MLEPHTALFVAPTGVGKTHLALDLLEKEYKSHFHFHYNNLSHIKTQLYIQESKMGLD